MSNTEEQQLVPGILDNYSETQKEILASESRKTRNKLFTIAAVIFISDLIALLTLNAVNTTTFIFIAVVPVIFVGLALLSIKEPLLAMILACVIFIALWVFAFIQAGNQSLIQGILVKIILIALLIAGFQNAIEAHRIRKEMK